MPGRRNYRKRSSKLVRQVYRNKKKISRVTGIIERKAIDATTTGADVNTTGATVQLTGLSEGTAQSTRVGDQVTAKSIMIRGLIDNSVHDAGTPVDCLVRIMVWRIRNQNGTTAVITGQILEAVDINSMQDWQRKDAFKMYYDQTYTMDTSQHTIIPFKIRLSRLNLKIRYEGTGGGQGDAMNNHFYISFFSSVAGAVNDPLITFTKRFVYDDA